MDANAKKRPQNETFGARLRLFIFPGGFLLLGSVLLGVRFRVRDVDNLRSEKRITGVLYTDCITDFDLKSQRIHVIAFSVDKEIVLEVGHIGYFTRIVIEALACDTADIHKPGARDQGKVHYGKDGKDQREKIEQDALCLAFLIARGSNTCHQDQHSQQDRMYSEINQEITHISLFLFVIIFRGRNGYYHVRGYIMLFDRDLRADLEIVADN